jgi:hypothetical protein
LEVFTPDRRHLAYSRDVLRRLWDEAAAGGANKSKTAGVEALKRFK